MSTVTHSSTVSRLGLQCNYGEFASETLPGSTLSLTPQVLPSHFHLLPSHASATPTSPSLTPYFSHLPQRESPHLPPTFPLLLYSRPTMWALLHQAPSALRTSSRPFLQGKTLFITCICGSLQPPLSGRCGSGVSDLIMVR